MCGIIGYIGNKDASEIIIQGLKYLEYRGYDSSGIALVSNGKINTVKLKGRIEVLDKALKEYHQHGKLAIGHTRWATHGKPSDENSHPFVGNKKQFAIVHNGIIENYLDIKEMLCAGGVEFNSQTDSEVIVHLLEYLYEGDTVKSILKAVKYLKGAFALGIVSANEPDVIYGVKRESPMVAGKSDSGAFLCSDIDSLRNFVTEAVVLKDEQIAVIKKNDIKLFDFKGNAAEVQLERLSEQEANSLNGHVCYMKKEIHEIPDAINRAIDNYKTRKRFNCISRDFLLKLRRINIIGCGTALHAGFYGAKLIKKFIPDIDVYTEMASEFKYDNVKIDANTLTITVSQSGETADTLFCQKMVKDMGGVTLTICNSPTSNMAYLADYDLQIRAWQEIAVASTKAFNCQEVIFALFVLDLALLRKSITQEEYAYYNAEILKLPKKASEIILGKDFIKNISAMNTNRKSVFYLGRGIDYSIALEGSLKLKELSYMHCEAYAAGELKHGTLALIEEGVLAIAIITDADLLDKICSNLAEVHARGAEILTITCFPNDKKINQISDVIIPIPEVDKMLSPIISVIPTQLIAYYIAMAKGYDVDKPRNLAKSVTVE